MEIRRFIHDQPVARVKGRVIEKEEVYRILRQRVKRVTHNE